MQVRNMLIAAGAALAGVTAIAAAPTAASAQVYRPVYEPHRPAYTQTYYRPRFDERRALEIRRAEERRRAEWRFHHRHEFYRY